MDDGSEARPRGRLVVLSGPSGVGKDTVIRRLLQVLPDLRRPVAFTTRAPRPGEQDGRDYSFIGTERFQKMWSEGRFLETATVHGHQYGTARERVESLRRQGRDVLLKIDVQGAAQLRRSQPDAVFVFLAPPSREELLQRLLRRDTESPEELETRTQDADRELAEAAWYHHRVVNDEVERAAREIADILEAGRQRPG